MEYVSQQNAGLLKHVAEAEGADAAVRGQLHHMHKKLRALLLDNDAVRHQIASLQKQQPVREPKSASCSFMQHLQAVPC